MAADKAAPLIMIVNDNVVKYIYSLQKDPPEDFQKLRIYAEENDVPIIRRETEDFIRVLIGMKKPARILEVGAGIAYSASFMAYCAFEAGCPNTEIITIENYPPRIEKAGEVIENFSRYGSIRLLEGDAEALLPGISGYFDIVFLDAAKAQYITFLPHILRLMEPGSVLLADNVLQSGDITRSRYITPRRDRTIHERMRAFLREITHCEELDTSIIPIGDGVSLSIRK